MADVFISTEENRKLFKTAIISYLNGTNNIAQTKHDIRLACTYRLVKIDAKNFAKNIPLFDNAMDENLNPDIITILVHLEMPTHKTYYTDQGMSSLYDVLTNQKEKNLDYLIELIDESYPSVHWFHYAYRPLLAALGILSFSYVQPQYFWMAIDWIIDMLPVVYHWLYHYVVQLGNLPIIGMGMQLILLAYYINLTFEYGLDPSEERVRNLVFRATALGLNFLAHLITYWSAGTLSWLPAAIFIASSCISIIESIYAYSIRRSPPSEEHTATNVHSTAWATRYKKESERNYYFFLIRLMYAITVTALVLTWTFLAPSAILTMAYMLSMWLALLIRDYCINLIKHQSADTEQTAVSGIYASPEFNPEGKLAADKAAFQDYATKILEQCEEGSVMHNLLQADVVRLLNSKTFTLQASKADLDTCVRCYAKTSPSPAAMHAPKTTLATSQMSLYHNNSNSERRKNLAGMTPLHGEKLDFYGPILPATTPGSTTFK